ncbi:MAG: HugZ family protein, partial [Pseudomonadota bacterium]
ANDNGKRPEFRSVFLNTHPKAEMYIDFLDFGFYPVLVERALLNGGFGKAYHLTKQDLSFLTG